MLLFLSKPPSGRGQWQRLGSRLWICALAAALLLARAPAQDNPLEQPHVTPPPASTPATGAPAGAEAPAATGPGALKLHPGARIRMNVDLVLIPVTITDPMNRLVTGLEEEDFKIYEGNSQQTITSFASEDAPVSIGIIFDLSRSMSSKLVRARESILEFIKTANPQDEFFVIGFNDRPELIEDFTNSVDDIQARLATVQSGHRTALLDAIYYGVAKMRDAHHERRALLVVSDGGDNRSRYTEGEVRAQVRGRRRNLLDRHLRSLCAHPRGTRRPHPAQRRERRDRRSPLPRRRPRRDGRHRREDFHRAAQPICHRFSPLGPEPRRQVA